MFFYNGTNYDFNLLINELAKEYKSDISCILLNTNKYMSFSIPMNRGLSVLVDNLSELTIRKCEDVKNKDIIVKAKKENGKDYICLRCN